MSKKESIEEAKARFEKNRERLRKKFAESGDEDLPPDATPGGHTLGPTNELSYRRIIRDIRESGGEEE